MKKTKEQDNSPLTYKDLNVMLARQVTELETEIGALHRENLELKDRLEELTKAAADVVEEYRKIHPRHTK
jgi:23S rRNA maturation mini-RNase III